MGVCSTKQEVVDEKVEESPTPHEVRLEPRSGSPVTILSVLEQRHRQRLSGSDDNSDYELKLDIIEDMAVKSKSPTLIYRRSRRAVVDE